MRNNFQPEDRVKVVVTLTVELDFDEWQRTCDVGSRPALFASAFGEYGTNGFDTAVVVSGGSASQPERVPDDET